MAESLPFFRPALTRVSSRHSPPTVSWWAASLKLAWPSITSSVMFCGRVGATPLVAELTMSISLR